MDLPYFTHVTTKTMALATSLIKFQGTIDGLTIDKNGVAKKAQLPRTITSKRSKENNSEFGIAAKQGKVIRDALKVLGIGDRFLTARMLKVVRSGIALDNTNDRGKRILSNNEARTVLKGFELNSQANFLSVAPVKLNWTAEATETEIQIKNLLDGDVILKDLSSPEGTTHAAAIGMAAIIDISPEVLQVKDLIVVQSEVATGTEPIILAPLEYEAPTTELVVIAVAIKFYQQVNNQFYDLQNGAYNVAKILDIYFTP
jgi:hypothetical protein